MTMDITPDTLPDILERAEFERVFKEYAESTLGHAGLFPKLSLPRVVETHGAWLNDLNRVEDHEPHLNDGLDHFKRCGHLAFWIRRMSPLVDVIDLREDIADSPGYDLTKKQSEFRELLFAYANEYLAFDFGYQFCRFYELGKGRAESLNLGDDYYRTMCHFLKYKTVSPHALFLIYKSLFAS